MEPACSWHRKAFPLPLIDRATRVSNFDSFMMFSELFMLNAILILPIIVAAPMPIWPSEGSSGSEKPSDQTSFSSDLALLPLDQDPLFENADNAIPISRESESGVDGLDFLSADDSLDLADCSASMFPTIGKSRIRRVDKPGSCKSPTGNAGTGTPSPDSERPQFDLDEEIRKLLGQESGTTPSAALQKASPEPNPNCVHYSGMTLPWGLCSSGDPADVTLVPIPLIFSEFGVLLRYTLAHCTL